MCDFPHLNEEINYLYEAFVKAGFPRAVLDRIHSKVEKKLSQSNQPSPSAEEERDSSPLPVICLPFNHFIDKIIKPVFQANNVRVVHPARNTIQSSLVRNKPSQSSRECDAAAVYAIPCSSCPKVYYGETGRGLNVRMREHERAVRGNYPHNACAKHVHQFDPKTQ